MVFLAPDIYNQIKENGRAEGRAAVAAAAREAMREAGVDDETRRRVEDALAKRARRNGL